MAPLISPWKSTSQSDAVVDHLPVVEPKPPQPNTSHASQTSFAGSSTSPMKQRESTPAVHPPTTTTKGIKKKQPSLSKPQPLVTFYVGPDGSKQTFVVHKNFATFYSPVLKNEFNLPCVEGETQSMNMENTDVDVFGKFVHWMYTKEFEENVDSPSEAVALARIWKLAESFGVVELQNEVMKILVELVCQCAKAEELDNLLVFAYSSRAGGGELKRLLLNKLTWDIEPEKLREADDRGIMTKEMWMDIGLNFSNRFWDHVPKKYQPKDWRSADGYLVVHDGAKKG